MLDFHDSCQPQQPSPAVVSAPRASEIHSNLPQHTAQLEDSAQGLLSLPKKGSAPLEDSATLQQGQQQQQQQHQPSVRCFLHEESAPEHAESSNEAGLLSPWHGPSAEAAGSSTQPPPTAGGLPGAVTHSGKTTSDSIAEDCCQPCGKPSQAVGGAGRQPPLGSVETSLRDPVISSAHSSSALQLQSAASGSDHTPLHGEAGSFVEAAMPLADPRVSGSDLETRGSDLQTLASASSETWEAVSYPSSGTFSSGPASLQQRQPQASALQGQLDSSEGFVPALRVLGWPSALPGPGQGVSTGEQASASALPSDQQDPGHSHNGLAHGVHRIRDAAVSSIGDNAMAPNGTCSSGEDMCHQAGAQNSQNSSAESCQHAEKQQPILCRPPHYEDEGSLSHCPSAGVASDQQMKGSSGELHSIAHAQQTQALGSLGTNKPSMDRRRPADTSAEARQASLLLNTLHATGYQQIDDWATLQPDGSMHDLPVSSLWGL